MQHGGLEAMFADMMEWQPATGWDVLRSPPKTAALLAQAVHGLDLVDRFLIEVARDGGIIHPDMGRIAAEDDEPTPVWVRDFQDAFTAWVKANRRGGETCDFEGRRGAILAGLGAEYRKGRPDRGDCHDKSVWCVVLPTLGEMQAAVKAKLGAFMAEGDEAGASLEHSWSGTRVIRFPTPVAGGRVVSVADVLRVMRGGMAAR